MSGGSVEPVLTQRPVHRTSGPTARAAAEKPLPAGRRLARDGHAPPHPIRLEDESQHKTLCYSSGLCPRVQGRLPTRTVIRTTKESPMHSRVLPMFLTTTLLLAACGGNDADSDPTSPPAETGSSQETAASQESRGEEIAQHSLPTAEVFGEPAWGMQIPPSWKEMTPIVTAQRIIALSDATVVAYDAQGAEAWSTDWQPLAEEDRAVGTPPVLRQVSPEVVAVIDTGKVEGEGLSTSTYAAQVTLISIGDGALIEEVTVPGSESDTPELAEIGLGFALPDRSAVIVTPEGEIVEAPAAHADARLVGAVSVGQHPIGLWETGSVSTLSSFGGSGWSSDDLLPNEATTQRTSLWQRRGHSRARTLERTDSRTRRGWGSCLPGA